MQVRRKISMKPQSLAIAAVFLVFSGCAQTSRLQLGQAPGGEVIDSLGEAPLDPGDVDGTKRKARLDAQKNAVERVVGVQISAHTRVEKAALIDSKILARSEGYILKYDVLKEWKEPPAYKSKIRALVAYQRVADDLRAAGILREPQIGNPRVAILLTETVKGADDAPSFAGDALAMQLISKGLRVVDRADLMAAKATSVQQELDKGDASHVASLGRQLDAEVLVFGFVEGAPLEDKAIEGFNSIRAVLSAKAYKAQSNEILASVSKAASGIDSARGPAVMKAFTKVGEMAGQELAPAILEALKRRAYTAITITGLHGLEQLRQVEDVVTAITGVEELYLRSFQGGEAHVDVQIRGVSPQDIARALEQATSLKAKVRGVTAETIEVKME